jgi:hypothetical protein
MLVNIPSIEKGRTCGLDDFIIAQRGNESTNLEIPLLVIPSVAKGSGQIPPLRLRLRSE